MVTNCDLTPVPEITVETYDLGDPQSPFSPGAGPESSALGLCNLKLLDSGDGSWGLVLPQLLCSEPLHLGIHSRVAGDLEAVKGLPVACWQSAV